MTRRSAHPAIHLNARLVREKDRARARELRRFVIYGAVIVAPLLAYVWQRVEFIRLSYQVEELKKERQTLLERQKQLSVERSWLLSPDRIEKVARRQLGLCQPAPEDVRRVRLIDGRIDEVGALASAGVPEGFGRRGGAPLALAGVSGALVPSRATASRAAGDGSDPGSDLR